MSPTVPIKKPMVPFVGFDQLCWHNFRIIGTDISGISIEHNSRIIGSGYKLIEGVVWVWFNLNHMV